MPHLQYLHLLVVEDNIGDFVLVEDYIREEHEQCSITHAQTFREAKEIFSKQGSFDAILLDLSLPDNSGDQLINAMMQLAGTAPLIVLTGYPDKEFSIRSLSLGVSDYLLKDELTPSQLYKSIIYSIERNRINLKLHASEENYRNLFHLSPLPMWVFDPATYRFLHVNEAAIKHYGYSQEEFLAMTIKDIRPKEEEPELVNLVNASDEISHLYKGPVIHRKKNGQLIHVEIQSNSIDFEGKKVRLVLVNDITERLHYMRAIEEQNRKLQEIAWLQSHVVRAPLARIMGLVDLITNHPTNAQDTTELLHHIETSAKELDKVIRTIVTKTEQIENR